MVKIVIMLCTTKKEKTLRMGSHKKPLLQSWNTKGLYLQSKDRWEINLSKKGTKKKLQMSTVTLSREETKNLPWEFEPQASSLESEVILSVWSTKAYNSGFNSHLSQVGGAPRWLPEQMHIFSGKIQL